MEEKIGKITETKAFEQLGILVLDGSGSMEVAGETGQPKAEEVNNVTRGLISRLKVSRRKENFYLSIVSYDHNVTVRLKPTPVTQIDDTADYNPLNGHGGETAIGDALETASKIAEEFLEKKTAFPRSVVIVLLTDGQNNAGKKHPVEVANKIKSSGKKITLCAAGYGRGEDVDALILQQIVSGSGEYIRAYDPEALRKFFEASVSKIRA